MSLVNNNSTKQKDKGMTAEMPALTGIDIPKFGACTYFAKSHPVETCGSNGLPLTPNSITILGNAQRLKIVEHPNLCTYVDVIRGKHERIIIVSEYTGIPISEQQSPRTHEEIIKIAYQIVSALKYLHSVGIIHRNLSPDNILIDSKCKVKLFNFGLNFMTNGGKNVSFPIGLPRYLSPESILGGGGPASDVWSLGIIVLELCLKSVWPGLKPGPTFRRIISLMQTSNPAQRIAREHDAINIYQSLPENLQKFLESCLTISPKARATISDLSKHEIFKEYYMQVDEMKPVPKQRGLLGCKIQFLYHWWQLAGGDIQIELKKQGLIKSSPSILSMPIAVLLDGPSLGGRSFALMDRRVAISSMDLLLTRLKHLSPHHFAPLLRALPKPNETTLLPKVIRERDTEYQFHRLVLFERLLKGYPHTASMIKHESIIDIPPLLRGEVWSALLDVNADIQEQYERIDKETPTVTDRQIDVDIPRCHQYCWLLCGGAGHNKLKRILKAWLLSNPQYVYWQGLDSLSAPFLFLNFNHEARAYACLSAFIPRFLHKFFLKDNSAVIKEYLAKFWQLTAFHEPKLASHLHETSFVPELFAIPWFLTMFSHVFPLPKILHLWDALLVVGSSLPLFMGVAILRQLRDTLLQSGFNECILLFSDLPEIDIEQCVKESVNMCESTPPSLSFRIHNKKDHHRSKLDFIEIPASVLQKEMCSRLSCNDFLELRNEKALCAIDIRPNALYQKACLSDSINVPYDTIFETGNDLKILGSSAHKAFTSSAEENKTFVIISNDEDCAQTFGNFLIKCAISRVCVLHGGIIILQGLKPALLYPHVSDLP